ncbi:MAG: delta-lactam-biosynthetic de-N-acetylase [Firmicutes bacterium]|nr:delta-lactam-biosynthetic de-N-acetylase [Bacillota bacterium]
MIIILKRKRLAVLGLIILAHIIALAAFFFITHDKAVSTSGDGGWGLSFQKAGQPPVANATAEELAQYNAYYRKDTDEKILYLTFDAGYENGYTEKILDVLKKQEVPAAFFLVGNYIESEPDIVKRMVKEGHIVGNHTYSHPDMSMISSEETFREELEKLEAIYTETTGRTMKKFYRPPQGRYSEENLKMACEMGYTTVFWSLAYVDWYENQQPSRDEAFRKMIPRAHPGAVILLHSTSKTNSEVLDELISKWKEMGYKFRPLDDLLKTEKVRK